MGAKIIHSPTRLSTLRDYRILDTEAEDEFDQITRLASEICNTPISLISLLDERRQWFKSKIGLEVQETPIEYSFCRLAIESDEVYLVSNAIEDQRFKNNPLVTQYPNIRFYAGAPLVARNGIRIGALCVVDTKPGDLNDFQIRALQTLAKQVITCLELRKLNMELAERNMSRERELEIVTDAAQIGIWEWNITNNALTMTNLERKLLGIPLDLSEITYADFTKVVHPDDITGLEENLSKVISTNGHYNSEFRIIKDGEIRWISGSGRVVLDELGNATRMVGVNFDTTILRTEALENEKLRIREHAAVSASLLKSEFLANMSHEIRTPINGIIGMTKLLLEESLSKDQKYFTETIKTSSHILLVLINDILDLSKIEAGKLELEIIPFSIKKLVNDVESSFRSLAKNKGLEFIVNDEIKISDAYYGDPSRIRQVLNNLISNALKFTKVGKIKLEIANHESNEGFPLIEFSIIDSGIGIPEKILKTLFCNFSQADSSTAREYGGSGLGLAICKRLVELMGGEIFVESESKVGSRFSFILHLQEAHPSKVLDFDKTINNTNSSSPEKRALFKILVAEDNAINQEVVLRLLSKAGFEAEVVANGLEAVRIMKEKKFDLILMDCQMPEMDGYRATEVLRENGVKIPIVALTANAFKEDKEKCLASGMSDYLTKPINFSSLIQTIEKHIGTSMPKNSDSQIIQLEKSPSLTETIDHTYIDRLRFLDEDGSDGLIEKLLNMFLEMTPGALMAIRAAALTLDPNLPKKAHALKSTCANLGVTKMVEMLQSIESQKVASDQMEKFLDDMDEEFSKAREEMQRMLQK